MNIILGFTCDREMDLVFVMDSSASVHEKNPVDGSYDNWELLLHFILGFVHQLTIGPDAFQVGIVR